LADLSAAFVNLPTDQFDRQVEESLKRLVEFLGNDRCTFVVFGDNDRHVLVTHSYSQAGVEAFPLGTFPVERLPWFIGQFRSGKIVFVRNIPEDLPPEASQELQYCRDHGIQSNVTVPLSAGGEVLGGLTFAFLRQRCGWSAEIISRLKLIGEVFANALLRRYTESRLKLALAENEEFPPTFWSKRMYTSASRRC
jgi:formate hydrogenlyase transcriptional activator